MQVIQFLNIAILSQNSVSLGSLLWNRILNFLSFNYFLFQFFLFCNQFSDLSINIREYLLFPIELLLPFSKGSDICFCEFTRVLLNDFSNSSNKFGDGLLALEGTVILSLSRYQTFQLRVIKEWQALFGVVQLESSGVFNLYWLQHHQMLGTVKSIAWFLRHR